MSITRGVVRNVVRNAVRGVVRAPSEIQRYFTESNSVTQTHGVPTSTPTITRLVMDVYSPTGSNVGLPTGAPVPAANKLETIDFAFAGTMPNIARNGASYFDGIIANVYAYNGATLVGFWPMDDAPSATYFRNDAAVLGSELVVNGGFDTDISGWSDVSSAGGSIAWDSGRLALINTTGTSRAQQIVTTAIGEVYLFQYTNKGSVKVDYQIGVDTGNIQAGETLTYFYTATGTTTTIQLKSFTTGTTTYADDVTIKEIPAATPLIEKIDYVEADTQLYTQVDVGWAGTELWTDGATGEIPGVTTIINSSGLLVAGNVYHYGDAPINVQANNGLGWSIAANTTYTQQSTTDVKVRNLGALPADSFTPTFKRLIEVA